MSFNVEKVAADIESVIAKVERIARRFTGLTKGKWACQDCDSLHHERNHPTS